MFCKTGSRIQFQTLVSSGLGAAEGWVTPGLTIARTIVDLVARSAVVECVNSSCSWWLISVHPWGGQRSTVGAGPAPVPTEQQMLQRSLPGVTVLKALLTLADGAGRQRQVIVDIGAGFTIGWYGPSASVKVVYVERNTADYNADTLIGHSQVVESLNTNPLIAPAVGSAVEDVLIEANIVPLTSSPNLRAQTLTNTYRHYLPVAEAFVRTIPRPAGAQRVSVYQDQAGGTGPLWALVSEPPFTATTASMSGEPLIQMPGAVFPDQSNAAPHQAVPGNAAGIIPDPGLLGTTVVWEIDV